jgi:hypothetical protein
MNYGEIRDRIIFGVTRKATGPVSLNRLRAVIDAAFPQINNQVAEVYAEDENKRSSLRAIKPLTFTTGAASFPNGLLKDYLKDCTLIVDVSPPQYYGYRPEYDDFLRGGDSRLGIWSANGNTIYANTPATSGSGSTGLAGAASFICICSPDIPTAEGDEFVAPADYVPDFIDTFIDWILSGKTMNQSAEAA